MQRPDQKTILPIRKSLLRWYAEHKRDLVWRSTTDAYKILVSEIMLQQTQVKRVAQKYPLFLKQFPTLRSIADASRADVIRAWQGMGYNNRAVRLQDLAKTLVENNHGRIPDDIKSLQHLPGIGHYTANAVACFSFKRRVAVVDVNVRRVLSRLFRKMKHADSFLEERSILEIAQKILPRDASTWNQALMDLGSTICVARTPGCDRCPVSKFCLSSHLGRLKTRPYQQGAKREPSHSGIPNRLWRGKIVESLRSLDDHATITIAKLGKSIKQNFRREEVPWLMNLVHSLSEDGILTIIGTGKNPAVKLPEE
jgi:A/G-specific adenine glycosylase